MNEKIKELMLEAGFAAPELAGDPRVVEYFKTELLKLGINEPQSKSD